MDSSLWLIRPQDIQAHMIYAATEIPSAVLTLGRQQIHGRLTAPNEVGDIAFVLDANLQGVVQPPAPGKTVKIDYEGNEDAYTFFTEMKGTDLLQRWLLASPKTIERTQQRLTARHFVDGAYGFELRVQVAGDIPETQMRDISNSGLSFIVASKKLRVVLNSTIYATVTVPGMAPFDVVMEVRHERPLPGDRSKKIVGVRFRGFPHSERTALSKALTAWRAQQRGS